MLYCVYCILYGNVQSICCLFSHTSVGLMIQGMTVLVGLSTPLIDTEISQ